MLKKTSLLIIIAMIFSCSQIYAQIANKVALQIKIDKLIAKMQNNYFMFGKGDSKVFEDALNELSSMGEGSAPYLLTRIKKAGQEEGNVESLSFMVLSEVYSLDKIGKPAVPYLIETFEDKSTPNSVRWLLVELMQHIRDERVTNPFIKVLLDRKEDAGIRERVAYNLGSFHSQKCVEALIKVLSEDNYTLRMRAATVLGRIGSKDAVPHLIKMLSTSDAILRKFVVEALGNIGEKSAVEPLIPLLNDSDWVVRSWTATALGRLKDTKAIAPLKKALKDEHDWVRRDAMIALGKLGDKEGFQLLIEALRTTSFGQQEIINALGEIGNKQAIEPLKEQLEVKREGVGLTITALITLSLAKLGNQDGYDEALECLKSKDPGIKIPAIQALGEIGNKSTIGLLTELLDDVNVQIRTEAETALDKINKNRGEK